MLRLILILIIPIIVGAQSIVGEWDSYTSALTLKDLVQVEDVIYAASPGGLVAFDKSNRYFKVYGPNDGLSYTDLQCLSLDKLGCLWLGMSSPSGEINIWDPATRQINKVLNSTEFGEELTAIETMTFASDVAFVAFQQDVNWGILYFKIDGNKYIYRDFFANFPVEFSKINRLAIIQDTLWVATDSGLLFADLATTDLKDPKNWKVAILPGQGNIISVIEYNDAAICSYGADIFRIEADQTAIQLYSSLSSSIKHLVVDQTGKLTAVTASGIFRYENGTWQTVSQVSTNQILIDDEGIIWGGTEYRGLLKNDDGSEEFFIPNSLLDNGNTALYIDDKGQLVAASNRGISFKTADGWYNILESFDYISIGNHSQANWNYYVADTIAYVVASRIYTLIKRNDDYFASLFGSYLFGPRGGGLLRFNPDDLGNYIVYDTSEGKLTASAGYGGLDYYLAIGYMTLDDQKNLWIANQFSQNDSCIAVLTPDDRWVHFSGTESQNYLNYLVTSIAFDPAGRVWFGSEPYTGPPVSNGGIAVLDYKNTLFDKSDDKWYWVSTKDGLASNSVYALAFDLENKLWIMTSGGIQSATISDNVSTRVFSAIDDPVLSNIAFAKECRIKVDGLNNKWISTIEAGVKVYTNNGVWLNDVEGFTTNNSGLLSDKILDIAFDSPKGLVYISTNKGISVYKSPYAYYGNEYIKTRVFPSPFKIPSEKPLTIDDLLQESEVKIMLLDGTFIRHLDARDGEVVGQQAFWDGRNEKGKLVSSGVYIFVAYTPEGDTVTGKIAVLRR